MKKHIYLIGFMGVGKTTIAEELSHMTDAELLDTDAMLVKKEGKEIKDIFAEEGEAYFRNAESRLLEELKERVPAVVSCGGGIVLRSENADIMKAAGTVIWLTATPESIYERVKDSTDRPVLNGNMNVDYIRSLLDKREEKYRYAADVAVATDGRTPEDIAEEICQIVNMGKVSPL